MKIYNKDKTKILENPDLEKGKLIKDTIHIHEDEKSYVAETGHYETVKEYDNGGKEVEFVIDKKGQEYKPTEDYDEEIYVYKPFTAEELKENQLYDLRQRRDDECFSVINRGELWHSRLTLKEREELANWYNAWLDVTETKNIPNKPDWLNYSN